MSESTALAYAGSAALAVVFVLATVGAVCVLVEGGCRLTRWLRR